MRVIHLKPTKDLGTAHVGVAEFEEKVREFVKVGGEGFPKLSQPQVGLPGGSPRGLAQRHASRSDGHRTQRRL